MSNQFVQKAVNISLSIRDCKCTAFTLSAFATENKQPISSDKYLFNFSTNINVDGLEKNITIEIISSLSANDENVKGNLANITSIHVFSVANLDEIVFSTDQGPALPEQAIPPLLGICFSNLRGMYAVKLENTIYANAILPLVDVNQLLPKKATVLG